MGDVVDLPRTIAVGGFFPRLGSTPAPRGDQVLERRPEAPSSFTRPLTGEERLELARGKPHSGGSGRPKGSRSGEPIEVGARYGDVVALERVERPGRVVSFRSRRDDGVTFMLTPSRLRARKAAAALAHIGASCYDDDRDGYGDRAAAAPEGAPDAPRGGGGAEGDRMPDAAGDLARGVPDVPRRQSGGSA